MTGERHERGTPHEFPVNTEFSPADPWTWKITNRMVDVDTGEVLYYLQGTEPGTMNHGEEKIITEESLIKANEQVVGYECVECGHQVDEIGTDGRRCPECGNRTWDRVVGLPDGLKGRGADTGGESA